MPHLTTLEACTRIAGVLRSSPTAMGDLDTYFVPHEETAVILCHTFIGCFDTVEFLLKYT